jgi:hypothetical protein
VDRCLACPRDDPACSSAVLFPPPRRGRLSKDRAGWRRSWAKQLLEDGVAAVRQAWADAGRASAPRIATGRYFSLGPNADVVANNYIRHYYGDAGFDMARADTLTSPDQIHHELDYLAKRGVTDLVLYPSSTDPDQIQLLVEALGPWPPERRSA